MNGKAPFSAFGDSKDYIDPLPLSAKYVETFKDIQYVLTKKKLK